MRTRSRRGFTLMELMTTVAIISILAALAVPSIRSVVADERLIAEGYGVGGWVYDSRMLALGLKRCIRIRGLDTGGAFASSEYTVDLSGLAARESTTGDCETTATITSDASYTSTSLPALRSLGGFTMRLQPTVTTVPVIWRPMGYLRGNGDSNFSDDGFKVKITDNRGKFVVVSVSAFGQVCTGRINESNPSC